MASEVFVSDARKWAEELVMREYRGPGHMERAMDIASRKTGIDRNVFWQLRYRKPNDILASVYFRLKQAYESECFRQERLLEHEISMRKATEYAVDQVVNEAVD